MELFSINVFVQFDIACVTVPFAIIAEIIVTGHVDNATPSFEESKINELVSKLAKMSYLGPMRRISERQHRPKPVQKRGWELELLVLHDKN